MHWRNVGKEKLQKKEVQAAWLLLWHWNLVISPQLCSFAIGTSSAGSEAAAGPGRSVCNVTGRALGLSQEEGERMETGSGSHSTGEKSSAAGRCQHPSLLGDAFFGVRLWQLVSGKQQLWFAKVSFPGCRAGQQGSGHCLQKVLQKADWCWAPSAGALTEGNPKGEVSVFPLSLPQFQHWFTVELFPDSSPCGVLKATAKGPSLLSASQQPQALLFSFSPSRCGSAREKCGTEDNECHLFWRRGENPHESFSC